MSWPRSRRLSVVSGLCLRYDNGFRETVRRIHDGAIGEVVTLCSPTTIVAAVGTSRASPDWTDMLYQMRNWYNFTWLSGDFNVEQHVHYLDVCAWVMKEKYPVKAVGMGGEQVLTGPEYGQIYDHFSVVYEYADGAKLVSNCRQQPSCKNDMSCRVLGTKGQAQFVERRKGMRIRSAGGEWIFNGPENQMYQTEHDELFASIRNGKPIQNGEYMARSTLLAIMGRMAAYTGQEITWEMALNSKESLRPDRYAWDAQPPVCSSRHPGPDAVPVMTLPRLLALMPRSGRSPLPRMPDPDAIGGPAMVHSTRNHAGTRSPAAWLRVTLLASRARLRRPESRDLRKTVNQPGQANSVPDRLHDAAILPLPARSGLSGIKSAGYRYVAWGTTHHESGKEVPVIAADAPPDGPRNWVRSAATWAWSP